MIKINDTEQIIKDLQSIEGPALTIYADINPANPLNSGDAWLKRIKNSLAEIPEIQESFKRKPSLNDQVLKYLEANKPLEGRTIVIVAKLDEHHDLCIQLYAIQAELPVVDLAHGRVDARYGEPYVTPIIFAFDEFEPTAVLHMDRNKWRLFEYFLGEIEECSDALKEFDEDDWKEIQEASQFVEDRLKTKVEATRAGDHKGPQQKKLSTWVNKIHTKLARLLEKSLRGLKIERLVLMGNEDETSHFYNALPKHIRRNVVARIQNPKNEKEPNKNDLKARLEPVLEAAERQCEMEILDEIKEQPGLVGMEAVIDGLQIGQVETLVVPFDVNGTIWRSPNHEFISANESAVKELCGDAEEIELRDHIFDLAKDFGSRLELVKGDVKDRLVSDFQGIAGKKRW